jgi:putative heme-binding domain-containing protein
VLPLVTVPPVVCAQEASAVGPILKLLQSGRLPAERQGTVVEMVCKRGNASDLAYVFAQLQKPGAFTPALRRQTLEWLTDAAVNRKVKPAGDLAPLGNLISDETAAKDPALLQAALELASVWKVASIVPELQSLALNPKTSDALQQVAIDGLVNIGNAESRQTIETLAREGKSTAVRLRAAAGLAKLDIAAAAALAPAILAKVTPQDDPAPLVSAFLNRQGGADKLAAALAKTKLPPDAAKLALRYMYSVGRSDPALSDVLSKAAGIATDVALPTPEEVAKITAEVAAKGNAARGEKIFRRIDVSCMKCHSVSHAGGSVGPELSAVGSISPVDYIVNSILNPNLAIKEQYVTKVILTTDGEVFTGVLVDQDDSRINLRDATGKVVTIPRDDIEAEREGKSLMPQGITKFLTHDEFLDLAKFVSQLGKPGEYAIRTTPSIQRWRVLKSPGKELTDEVPNVEILRENVLDTKPAAWATAYGMVAGTLPLAELRRGDGPAVLYLQGEVEVIEPGLVQFEITSTEPTQVWIDAEPFESQTKFTKELAQGKHTITLRVAVSAAEEPMLKVELQKPAGSSVQYTVVNGT